METYKHTSIGWIPIGAIIFAIAGTLFIPYIIMGKIHPVFILIVFVIIVVCGFLFPILTVTGDKEGLRVHCFPGLVSKKFPFQDIESFRKVKKRYTQEEWVARGATRGKYLFYMAGLEGVELVMKNGKKYQIGSDEPEKLIEFIREKLKEPTDKQGGGV